MEFAKTNGWTVFAIHNTECFTAVDAGDTYQQYGKSDSCRDGKGGFRAQNVYELVCILGNFSLKFYYFR